METITTKRGMKAKSIKGRIHRKINLWLDSVEDEALRGRLKNGVIVTGGSIASMLLGEEVNDFDIYLRSYDLAKEVAEYYLGKFQQKHRSGIKMSLKVYADGTRVKIVVKSAGVASDEGTENLKDLKVLEDQLTGVDTAYFIQLLDRLREKDPEKVDGAYLVEIIDGIF
jgi:hypothetical protein